jgi:hypothetical protein
MTSEDRCYCGVRGTRAVADSSYNGDGPYDISEPLLIPPTIATSSWHQRTVATVGHVEHARLLIVPTTAMGRMTSADHCYCGARSTHASATSAHSSDGPWDISRLLLLPPTMATDHLTSADRCYYGARGTRVVPTSPKSSDGSSDISGSLLLPSTVVTGYMTSDDHCYCWAHGTRSVATSPHSSNEHSDISGLSALAPIVAMG